MNNNSIALRDELVTIFVILDDLCSALKLNRKGVGHRNSLSISEVAVISLIRIKYSIRNWKSLYDLLNDRYSREFHLPCYKNFVI